VVAAAAPAPGGPTSWPAPPPAMATAAAGPPGGDGNGTPEQWGAWTAQATPVGQTPAPGDAAPQASPAQPTVGDGAPQQPPPADQHPASTTPDPTGFPKRPPPVLHRPPRPRYPGPDATAEIMRKALAERSPVAPDAIVHNAPEVCTDPGSGDVLTPAQVLQKLVDEGASRNTMKLSSASCGTSSTGSSGSPQ